jgi:glycerol dehydrogenase-like iron-containing ADH family enzyme
MEREVMGLTYVRVHNFRPCFIPQITSRYASDEDSVLVDTDVISRDPAGLAAASGRLMASWLEAADLRPL